MDDKDFGPTKGMKDTDPAKMFVLKDFISKLEQLFQIYGGLPLDTPVVERMKIVKGLYGEEFNKLVYTIDKGKLFLRYDLTLSLARYVANNSVSNFKRYTIGKVYRRDKPQIYRGRYREFWQCDFDIVGNEEGQALQEIEIISLIDSALTNIIKGEFVIRINDKSLLFDLLRKCGIKEEEIISTCNLIDKGENIPVCLKSLIEDLRSKSNEETVEYLSANYTADLSNIIPVLSLETKTRIVFDPFLARGLDYYTGLIYEVECMDKEVLSTSIIAGGRCDKLVESIGGESTPMIGVSFGLDRIMDIMVKRGLPEIPKANVYVASAGNGVDVERMKLCLDLRNAGIFCETNYWKDPKIRKQLDAVFAKKIETMIIIGEKEVADGMVQVKMINEKRQIEMPRENIVQFLKSL